MIKKLIGLLFISFPLWMVFYGLAQSLGWFAASIVMATILTLNGFVFFGAWLLVDR